jgi:hypothetical protein
LLFMCFILSRIPWPLWAVPPAFSEAVINYFLSSQLAFLIYGVCGNGWKPQAFLLCYGLWSHQWAWPLQFHWEASSLWVIETFFKIWLSRRRNY